MPIRPENRDRYPKDWALRSRFVRVYRARNRCEWCGSENGQPHPITGSIVVLTTAHVYDERPEVSSLLNLAGLCQLCHNRHDAKGRQERRRVRLGKPAPSLAREEQLALLHARVIRSAKKRWGVYRPSPKERRVEALKRLEIIQ